MPYRPPSRTSVRRPRNAKDVALLRLFAPPCPIYTNNATEVSSTNGHRARSARYVTETIGGVVKREVILSPHGAPLAASYAAAQRGSGGGARKIGAACAVVV